MGNQRPGDECFGIVARGSGDVRNEPIKYNIKKRDKFSKDFKHVPHANQDSPEFSPYIIS